MDKRSKKITIVIIMIFMSLNCCILSGSDSVLELYGKTSEQDYLLGKFEPSKHPLFVSLSALEIPTYEKEQYLRKEAAAALLKMYKAFKRMHNDIRFYVRSSTRNWDNQKAIWEGKWNGLISVEGKQLNRSIPDPLERARKILEYSSMPGTSRHHWGTDFDLCELNNEYYESGDGRVLYDWLKKNAAGFGFCQPYTAGRESGYHEEKWHWSYLPLSGFFQKEWIKVFGDKKYLTRKGLFAGSEIAGKLAQFYMSCINSECR